MHLLNPGLRGSPAEFRERFAPPIEREGDSVASDRAAGNRPVRPPPA